VSPTTAWVPGNPRLAYDVSGHGPTVVFLHGIGGNRGNWRRQLAALADRWRAVAWDARGYGASDDYPGPLDFADFSHDLARLLDHLGVDAAHLCGLSMGGRIALDFYERYRTRVRSLILADSFPGFEASFTPAGRQRFIDERRKPLLEGKTVADLAPLLAPTLVSPAAGSDVVQELVDSLSALHPTSYLKTIEAMTLYEPMARLEQVSVPVQLIVGADDRLTPPAVSRGMAAALPNAELLVLERAGHLSNIERPAAFNAALRAFLERQT
jgi:3-oxoadipate enol-lactonase